jgi:hypothetical protein
MASPRIRSGCVVAFPNIRRKTPMGNGRVSRMDPVYRMPTMPRAEGDMRRAERRLSRALAKLIGHLYGMRGAREGTPEWRTQRDEAKLLRKSVRLSLESMRRAEWRAAQRRALQQLRAEAQQRDPSPDRDWLLAYLHRRIRRLDLD